MNSSVLRNLESSPHETDGSNAVQPGGRMKGHAPSVGKAWQAISRGKIKRSVALDTVADSNTTGSMAARLICHLKSAISNQAERGTSACRFVDELPAEDLAALWNRLHSDGLSVEVHRQQWELVLWRSQPRTRTNRTSGRFACVGAIKQAGRAENRLV